MNTDKKYFQFKDLSSILYKKIVRKMPGTVRDVQIIKKTGNTSKARMKTSLNNERLLFQEEFNQLMLSGEHTINISKEMYERIKKFNPKMLDIEI